MEVKIEQLKNFSFDIVSIFSGLLEQLNPNSKALTDVDVKKIIEEPANRLFVAREPVGNKIVGMLTLVVVKSPSGKKGLLEDIVVDENYRGNGIGTRLINEGINQARKEGIMRLEFTSNPERLAANSLYQHLGFKKRDTNVYRVEL